MRSARRGLIPLALALIVASGCLEGSDGRVADTAGAPPLRLYGATGADVLSIDADWASHAVPMGEDHDHKNITHHRNLSTPNFQVLGHDPLITDYYGRTAGDYLCGDTKVGPDGRRLSVVHSWGSDVAMIIIDVTDPNEPRKIGELVMANTQVYDVAITPDLRYALMSTSYWDSGPDTLPGDPVRAVGAWGYFRDACTGEARPLDGPEAGLPYQMGLVLIDMANPRNPYVADFRPMPVWGHSVRTEAFDGQTLILYTAIQPRYFAFFDILEQPGGPRLNLLSLIDSHVTRERPGGHDGWMAVHPLTGERLAYLAGFEDGLAIFNIDDPTTPRQVGFWRDFDALGQETPPHAFFHGVFPAPEAWDGRHYTFAGEECLAPPTGAPTCIILTLDTTDPRRPTFVGAWTVPVPLEWREVLEFSLHYFALQNRTLLVSNYHGGLWAVDVSSPEALRMMPTVGVFVPEIASPKPAGQVQRSLAGDLLIRTLGGASFDQTPLVLDLDVMPDGSVVVFDSTGGVYSVRFDASQPAPPPEPWRFGYHDR